MIDRGEIFMKFSDLLKRIKQSGSENPMGEAFLLAEKLFCVSSASLLADPDKELPDELLDAALERRENGEPLQYILGEWDFYGLTFFVGKGCLIPRSDTEILVEEAIRRIPENTSFADLCCGSGCIGLSVLKNRPDLTCYAVDLFDTPLSLTEKNAERHGLSDRIRIVRADVLKYLSLPSDVSFILSNPPYIAESEMDTLAKELSYEPKEALVGGEDGLDFYRAIMQKAAEGSLPVLFEIGYDQAEQIKTLAEKEGRECEIFRDLGGNNRVALIKG